MISVIKKPEYVEGPKATERFEKGMKLLFQAPKSPSKMKPVDQAPKKKRSDKS